MATPRHRRTGLHINDITALMLLGATLFIALFRLANDDGLQMARRVTELSRIESTAQLSQSVSLLH